MKEEILIRAQFALYLTERVEKPEIYYQDMNMALDSVFTATPLIQPIPDDPQLDEVPIVQMSTETYILHISRKRVDFFLLGRGEEARFAAIKEDFINKASSLVDFLLKRNLQIQWVGFVADHFVEYLNPSKIIASLVKKELRDLHEGDTSETFVRYGSRIKILDTEVNNLTEIDGGRAFILGDERSGLLIRRDFNTKPSGSPSLTSKFVASFIQESEKRFAIKQIIELL